MTSETLAKSLESESKSGQGAAISIFGVYWIALRSKQGSKLIVTRMATMMAIPSHWGRLYFYMDEDNFDHDDVNDEDYNLLKEDADKDVDSQAEEDIFS